MLPPNLQQNCSNTNTWETVTLVNNIYKIKNIYKFRVCNSDSAWLNFEWPSNLLNTKETNEQIKKIALKILNLRFSHFT